MTDNTTDGTPDATHAPVPDPLETRVVTVVSADQHLSEEQRNRVCSWLRANDVDPRLVACEGITVQYRVQGDRQGPGRIFFTQFYEDAAGHRVWDPHTRDAVKFPRCIPEKTKLEPEPGAADA